MAREEGQPKHQNRNTPRAPFSWDHHQRFVGKFLDQCVQRGKLPPTPRSQCNQPFRIVMWDDGWTLKMGGSAAPSPCAASRASKRGERVRRAQRRSGDGAHTRSDGPTWPPNVNPEQAPLEALSGKGCDQWGADRKEWLESGQ